MNKFVELAPNFLLNAAWQISAVALFASLAARLLRHSPARHRHLLWVAALAAGVALPLSGLYGRANVATPAAVELTAGTIPARDAAETSESIRPALADEPRIAAAPGTAGGGGLLALDELFRRRTQPVAGAASLARSLAALYALFLLCRAVALWRAWLRAARLRRTARERELPPRMRAVAERCRAALGLRSVVIKCSAEVSAPVTVGALRPLILLPESFFADLSDETLASVIGHETAHVARRDFALNLVYELLFLPVSFHPLAWLIKRRIGRTRELACDELVVGRVVAPDAYARSLVRVAGALVSRKGQAFTLGVFDADILEERIMRLTRHTRRTTTARAARLLALSALSFLSLSCLAVSTFSFELRAAAAAATAGDDDARTPEAASGRARDAQHPRQKESAARDETAARDESDDVRLARGEIARALASDNSQTRARAACEAGRKRAVELIPALVSMLGDDAPARPFKCWARGNWSPALDTFKQFSPGEQAAIALASMGVAAVEPLSRSLDSSDAGVRRNAAWAVGELTDMRGGERAVAVPRLLSLLGDSDEWVRMAAARALGELKDERAATPLVGALADGEWRVRELAAWSLGELKDERAVESLCAVLASDSQAGVRVRAAWALGEIQNRRAVASLKQALNDPEPRVREKAQWALSEIEDGDG